jgi:hypothetical protein
MFGIATELRTRIGVNECVSMVKDEYEMLAGSGECLRCVS